MQRAPNTQPEEKEVKEKAGAPAASDTELRHDIVLPRSLLTGKRISSQHARKLKHPHTALPSVAPETELPEFELAAPRRHRVFGHNTFMGQPVPDNFYNVLPSEALLELYNTSLGFKRKKFAKVLFCRTDEAAEQFQREILDKIISAMVRQIYVTVILKNPPEDEVSFEDTFSAELWEIAKTKLHKITLSSYVYLQMRLAHALDAALRGDSMTAAGDLIFISHFQKEQLTVAAKYLAYKLAPLTYKDGIFRAGAEYNISTSDHLDTLDPEVILELVSQCDHEQDPGVLEALAHPSPMLNPRQVTQKTTTKMRKQLSKKPKPHSYAWIQKIRQMCTNFLKESDPGKKWTIAGPMHTAAKLIVECPAAIDAVLSLKDWSLASNLLMRAMQHMHDIRENSDILDPQLLSRSQYIAAQNFLKIARALTTLAANAVDEGAASETQLLTELTTIIQHILNYAHRFNSNQRYSVLQPLHLTIKLNLLDRLTGESHYQRAISFGARAILRDGLNSEDETIRTQAQQLAQSFKTWAIENIATLSDSTRLIWWHDVFSLQERQEIFNAAHVDSIIYANQITPNDIPLELHTPFTEFVRTHAFTFSRELMLNTKGSLLNEFFKANPGLALTFCQQPEQVRISPAAFSAIVNVVDDPNALVNLFRNRCNSPTILEDFIDLDTLALLVEKTKTAENKLTWEELLIYLKDILTIPVEFAADGQVRNALAHFARLPYHWLAIVADFAQEPDNDYQSVWEIPQAIREHPRLTAFIDTLITHIEKLFRQRDPLLENRPSTQDADFLAGLYQQLTNDQRIRFNRINHHRNPANLFDNAWRCLDTYIEFQNSSASESEPEEKRPR